MPAPSKIAYRLLVLFLLAMASGGVLYVAWLPSTLFHLLFIGFIPLLLILDLSRKWFRCAATGAFLVFPAMLLWNLDASWIYAVDHKAGILTITLNALVMTLPFLLVLLGRIPSGRFMGHFLLLMAWLCMEIFHHTAVIGFPMFTLGYGIAHKPELMQWYEWSGVMGGSAWILVVNMSVYEMIRSVVSGSCRRIVWSVVMVCLLVLLPTGISIIIFKTHTESGSEIRVAALNTSVDVHEVKYQQSNQKLLEDYITASWFPADEHPDLLIWPETALPEGMYINEIEDSPIVDSIRRFLSVRNVESFISGAVLREGVSDPAGAVGEKFDNARSTWYREYNGAVFITNSDMPVDVKSKYRCVPFTEYTPSNRLAMRIKRAVPSLAGFRFSVSDEHGMSTFSAPDNRFVFKPMICYESAFCNFFPDEPSGGSIICVLMNEGWYRNRKVSEQFHFISAVRGVEQRKSVARSSNLGISGFINQRGETIGIQSAYSSGVIIRTLYADDHKTFYSKYFKVILFIPIVFIMIIYILILAKRFLIGNS
jgi:apolipoprotein N-acyltransferase